MTRVDFLVNGVSSVEAKLVAVDVILAFKTSPVRKVCHLCEVCRHSVSTVQQRSLKRSAQKWSVISL